MRVPDGAREPHPTGRPDHPPAGGTPPSHLTGPKPDPIVYFAEVDAFYSTAVVLDSVLPPQQNIVENGWDSAARSYRAIFDACAAEAACALAYPHVSADFARLVNELSVNPRTVTVTDRATGQDIHVVIDGYKLASGVIVATAQAPGELAKVPPFAQA